MEACNSPVAPLNGTTEPSNRITWMPGEVVRFDCDFGFILEGNKIQVCGENGRFNGTTPECVGQYLFTETLS